MASRLEVLDMLSRGAIDVEQAAELLNAAGDAVEGGPEPRPEPDAEVPQEPIMEDDAPEKPKRKGKRRWLHIHVSDLETGRHRVRVNVPLGLVHVGLRVGARFTNELHGELVQDVLDALHDETLSGTLVEVEDVEDNERVHIFVD